MAEYAFATTWVLEAPIDRVWAALLDSAHWRDWVPGLRRVVELEAGDADGVGAVLEATVRASLPYELALRVRITRVEPPRLLELTALGDLEGSGRGTLAEEDGATTLRLELRVRTTKPWMNALAPVARPVFGWNHHLLMRAAGRRLAERLGARLLANESGPVEPSRGPLAATAVLGVVALSAALIVAGRRRASGD